MLERERTLMKERQRQGARGSDTVLKDHRGLNKEVVMGTRRLYIWLLKSKHTNTPIKEFI